MSDLKPVSFFVPGEPQGKGRARIGKVGNFARMYTPAKTVAYEGLIALAAQDVMQGRALIEGPVMIELRIVHSVPQSKSKKWKLQALAGEVACMKKPDSDNCLKAVCDALNGVVFKDDVQVTDGSFRRRWGAIPGVHVRIVPLCL
ncbi:RusA family crossover junction endodeoxyribonuclease [Pseudomonas sp. LY-1]